MNSLGSCAPLWPGGVAHLAFANWVSRPEPDHRPPRAVQTDGNTLEKLGRDRRSMQCSCGEWRNLWTSLTSKLDALNYSGSIWLQRDQKVGWTKRRHGRLSSSGAYLGYLHYSIEWPRHARHSIHADRLLDEISSPHQNTTGFWMFLNYTIIILYNDM